MKKTAYLLALGAGLMIGCGGSGSNAAVGSFTAINGGGTTVLTPPALPARIVNAIDPEGGDNEDVSSPDDLTFDVSLRAGWNALTFQVDLVTQIVAGPGIVGFTTYEEGEFLDPEPLTTDTVNRGEGAGLGFLVFCTQDTTLRYRGTPPAGVALAGLEAGWNLVEPPSDRLQDLNVNNLAVFALDSQGQPQPPGASFEPGRPVWVYSPTELEWRIPHRPSPTVAVNPSGPAPAQSNKDYPEPKVVCDAPEEDDDQVRALAYYKNTRWTPGQTINVLYLDGQDVPAQVYDAATQLVRDSWGAHANLNFNFYQGDGEPGMTYHITVKFLADKGWNSRLGKFSARNNPSMYLSRLNDYPVTSAVFQRVVMHEFGHALGAIHEHQNPDVINRIQWNKEAVYKAMARPPGRWTRATTDNAYFNILPTDLHSEFDEHSIMLYQIYREWTLNGFSSPYISKFSELDAEWARQAYP